MKKLIVPLSLLTVILLACNLAPAPSVSTPASPTPTQRVSAPEPVASLQPAAPVDAITVQYPMVSDPNAGQAKFRLMELGYDICTITADYYNYQTEAAIREFQVNAGLEAHGGLDPLTLERLLAADAPSSPVFSAVPLNTSDMLYMETGDMVVATSDAFWVLQGNYFVQFSHQGDFLGFYQIQPLSGEEDYYATAVAFDGTYLWIAQQSANDAIVQAYDPAAANPTDGLLLPALSESMHIPSLQMYPAAAFDGQYFWFLTDDLQTLTLRSVDVASATFGTSILVGESSGYGYGYGITYDPTSRRLWLAYTDEIFGEQAIVSVDPATGKIGPALGPCGRRVTYALSRLWFVNQLGLWSYDPASGERILYDYYADEQLMLTQWDDSFWLLDASGTLVQVETP